MAKRQNAAAADGGLLDAPAFGRAAKQLTEKDGPVSFFSIDLDDLYSLNVAVGRPAGDRFISAATATIVRAAAQEKWTVGRIGGDEFTVLLPGVALEQAFLRAEKLRAEIGEALKKAVPERRCTASIGVANYPRDAKNADELARKAGLALYAAKEQGGDAVSLTPGENMVLRSSYYAAPQLGRLRSLAERHKKKEAVLLREALDDLLRKYERAS
ncbi:MAG TPA: diguanylate cyclase [Candidatus Limnocylindria bacterium]|nr:diguanylate cyclase [Candidatus Limnocylindria bacterium]